MSKMSKAGYNTGRASAGCLILLGVIVIALGLLVVINWLVGLLAG